jgi:hypothetical protein
MKIELDISGGRFHWLSPAGRFPAARLKAIREKHRKRWLEQRKKRKACESTAR